jgi:hypothetical protein
MARSSRASADPSRAHTVALAHTLLSALGMTPNPTKRMGPPAVCVLSPSYLPEETRPLLQALQYALDDHARLGRSRVQIRCGRGWPRPELFYEVTVTIGELACAHRDYELERAILGAFERTYEAVAEHWRRAERATRDSARPLALPPNERSCIIAVAES